MAAPESECGGTDGYRDLRGVRVELDPGTARVGGGGGFAVSFWLYLSSSARPSSVILRQVGWIPLSFRVIVGGFQGIVSVRIVFVSGMGTGREQRCALLLLSRILF
jgi:hypothetical protein